MKDIADILKDLPTAVEQKIIWDCAREVLNKALLDVSIYPDGDNLSLLS